MTTVADRSRQIVSRSLIDQLAPVLELYEQLRSGWPIAVDAADAFARVRAGRPAVDPKIVLDGAGDLTGPVSRALTALERAGVATTTDVYELSRGLHAATLMSAWLDGDPLPPRAIHRTARRAAGLVGTALLRRASDIVAAAIAEAPRPLDCCPCCGGTPDISLVSSHERQLVCSRCDTIWPSAVRGCLGCRASAPPGLVRVKSPYLGYALVVCNSCGRYIKERSAGDDCIPLVERELTALLDEAAADRGLRI